MRGYLQREFPLCTVYDFYDFQRNAQVFQLQDNHGEVTQLISMTAEFFDTHRDLEIRAWIEKHRLAHAMRQAGQAGVLVSQAGPSDGKALSRESAWRAAPTARTSSGRARSESPSPFAVEPQRPVLRVLCRQQIDCARPLRALR